MNSAKIIRNHFEVLYFRQRAAAAGAVIAGLLFSPAPAPAQTIETVLYAFGTSGLQKDGYGPSADLISDSAGNLYGTTEFGGAHRKGAAFMLTRSSDNPETWMETVLYSFGGHADGRNPIQGLIMDGTGALYGTTPYSGGRHYLHDGVVFRLVPPQQPDAAWTEEIIYRFCSVAGCKDGSNSNAPLTLGPKDVLYGTTASGGSGGGGVLFQLTPPRVNDASWTYTVLANFSDQAWGPWGRLLVTADGSIFGTTAFSGELNTGGTLFRLSPENGGYHFDLLHDFALQHHDGTSPVGVTADKAGILYGVTEFGGQHDCGTVYSFDPAAAEYRQLYSFCPKGDGTDGRTVAAGLTIRSGQDGKAIAIYGTARGSDVGYGTVFKLTPRQSGPWQIRVLHTFCPARSKCKDGDLPASGLLPLDGGLYGITAKGGHGDKGLVYRLER